MENDQPEPDIPEVLYLHQKLKDSGLPYSVGGYEDQYFLLHMEIETVRTAESNFWTRLSRNAEMTAEAAAKDKAKNE